MKPGARVVDASAAAALLFGEPRAEEVADRLGEALLLAPTLLPYEVGSVFLKKLALHPAERTALEAALGMLARLRVREVEVPVPEVTALAERTGLTVYDAAYLWLARTLACELVTLDDRLAAAAEPARGG